MKGIWCPLVIILKLNQQNSSNTTNRVHLILNEHWNFSGDVHWWSLWNFTRVGINSMTTVKLQWSSPKELWYPLLIILKLQQQIAYGVHLLSSECLYVFLTVRIVYDKDSGRSRGFGFVNFTNVEDAQCAKDAMDGKASH